VCEKKKRKEKGMVSPPILTRLRKYENKNKKKMIQKTENHKGDSDEEKKKKKGEKR
jgi:hypothetical protein